MARTRATKVQNKFIKGLITEATALGFPEDACVETFDCFFDKTGRVSRRGAFELESNSTPFTLSASSLDVWTEFVWRAVAGDGDITFLVQQQGNDIYFFDISESDEVSPNKKSFSVSLTNFLPAGSPEVPNFSECQYAQGNGKLIIVNPKCDVVLVTYDTITDSISTQSIQLQERDFEGVDDGFANDYRPIPGTDPIDQVNLHTYNIANQGWYLTTAISQWIAARSDIPSNADVVSAFRASETDPFDPLRVESSPGSLVNSLGNSRAPRGHFILDIGNPNRYGALNDEEGLSLPDLISGNFSVIDQSLGSNIGDMTSLANSFDDDETSSSIKSSSPANGFVGKTYTTSFTVGRATVKPPNTTNSWTSDGTPGQINFFLYGKTGAAPAAYNDGTLLGTTAVSAGDAGLGNSSTITIASSDFLNSWDHLWIAFTNPSPNVDVSVAEVVFESAVTSYERVSVVNFFQGRAFYSGLDIQGKNNEIYFTQIIEEDGQFGKCYQQNDPVNEFFPDLLPSDGGVIKILEIDKVVRLFNYQTSMIVLATNGVWLISGSPFTATSYTIRKISDIGVCAPNSVVSRRGNPVWWGEDGIYTVVFNAENNSFEVIELTEETIKTFILDIPDENRKYVKGAYDLNEDIIYWLYNADDPLAATDHYKFNRVLLLNGQTRAFFPWTISDHATIDVRGIFFIRSSCNSFTPIIKYTTSTSSGAEVTYSEIVPGNYQDWTSTEYSSYLITGHSIDNEADKFFQVNYITVYIEPVDGVDSGMKMRTQHDFYNSGNSGKWSRTQECYNTNITLRDVNSRKLKTRGKGRAIQIRFESVDNKPFTTLGWVLDITGHGQV